jgi:transcriptional regulator with XRE-family HTH domain
MLSTRDPLTVKIGERIRETRQQHSLSLSQLSARTEPKLSKSRISNYEQGIRRPGIEQAIALAQAFGDVPATYLLCLDETGPFTPAERRLLMHYRKTDERGRAAILGIAKTEASSGKNAPKMAA